MKCIVVIPPATDACGKAADFIITFKDEQTAPACQNCALHLQQTAEAHGTKVSVKKIAPR